MPAWKKVWAALSPARRIYVAEAGADLSYDAADWRQPSVLIVGNEARGQAPKARQVAVPVAIPVAHGGTESLSAAMAGTVILFEAARQRRLG